MKLIKQPDDYSCGITCVQMIVGLLKNRIYSINELSKLCNFFKYLGTNSSKIKILFNKLDIKYTTNNMVISDYKEYINDNFILQLIYLEDKTPHWVIIENYINNEFKILDPYYGVMFIDENRLDYLLKYKGWKFLPKLIVANYIGNHTFLINKNR